MVPMAVAGIFKVCSWCRCYKSRCCGQENMPRLAEAQGIFSPGRLHEPGILVPSARFTTIGLFWGTQRWR